MDFIIDSQGGSQSAGAQTGYSFYGEQHVICGVLLSAQSQFFLQSLQDRNRFTYMTGSPVTDLDDIFSLWFKRKVFIKGCYTVGLGLCHADLFGYVSEQLSGQITVFFLNFLHNGDQRACFPSIVVNDLSSFFVVALVKHALVPPCS